VFPPTLGVSAEGVATADPDIPDPPVVEIVTLPGSGATYDVTTIGGIAVSNFSVVLGTLTGLSVTGSPTELGLRLSDDGGSTFDTTTTFQRKTYYSGSEVDPLSIDNNMVIHTGLAASGNAVLFMLRDLNTAAFPVSIQSAELSPVSDGTQKQYFTFHRELTAKDAFQLIVTGGVSPEMTAGELTLEGFR